MAGNATIELVCDSAVRGFLQKHGAEEEFQKVCELVHLCYPEMVALESYLQEDPDEDGRHWVVIAVTMPTGYSFDALLELNQHYRAESLRILSRGHDLVWDFAVRTRFAQEWPCIGSNS